MEPLAVGTAGFLHLVIGIAFYYNTDTYPCSPAPPLASWIYTGAVMLLAKDIETYPIRYIHLPYTIKFVVELLVALIILEIGSMVVWCQIERLIYQLVRLFMLWMGMDDDMYLRFEKWILVLPTTALAGILLYIMKRAIIPRFKLKHLYMKKQVGIQLNRSLYEQAVEQNQRRILRFRREHNI